MSKLLEIFGKGITIDNIELVWNWLAAQQPNQELQDVSAQQLGRVIELLSDRKLQQAEEQLRFYLFEKPDCVKGRMAACAICLQQNDIQGAIEQAQSVYLRQPNNTLALYMLGLCHERLGHQAEAIEFYQDCLKFKRYLQLPCQRIAAIYFRRGQIDKCIEQYRILTAEHPDDIESLVLLGYLYITAEQYMQAIDTFNLAILSHPDNFNQEDKDIQFNEWLEQGLYEQAMDYVHNIMAQIGSTSECYIQLGDICRHAGRSAEAITYYETAIRLQPNSLEATIKLGSQYLRDQHPGLAAEQFNRAGEINDSIVDAYAGLALAQTISGLLDEADQTLSLTASIHQNSILLFAETAALYMRSAETQEGEPTQNIEKDDIMDTFIQGWKRRIDASGPNADLCYKYGMLMTIRGQLKQAINWFKQATEVNSTHYRSRIKLCLAMRELGQTKESLEVLRQAVIIPPHALELHYQTAILFCDKKRFAQAMRQISSNSFHGLSCQDTKDYIEVILENLGIIDRAFSNWSRIEETTSYIISGMSGWTD